MRLLQHQDSISSALKQNSKHEDFTSALLEHIFDFLDLFILFDNVYLISRNRSLKQNIQETVEIKNILFKDMGLDRDPGDLDLNFIYDSVSKLHRVWLISPEVFNHCQILSSNKTNKPETGKSRRFASGITLKKE